jgi:oxygen-independent coproporphyrinogen-3 oxidase
MSKLIKRAKQIRNKLNLAKLNQSGIKRNREEYEFIVTYPAIPAMSRITQEDIFSGGEKERDVQFYTHLPFCTGVCTYCARFQKLPGQPQKAVDEYLSYLEKENEIMKSIPELKKMRVGSVYVGGGTPTYLTSTQLHKLTKFLTSNLDILEGAEFTVEGSPETIQRDKLEIMLANGVNRISMGVQSYQDNILRLCGRRHNSDRAKETSRLIRDVGFNNFNIDLILGLPSQSLKSLEEDLESAIDSGVTCVTTYPLYIRPGCGMAKFPRSIFPTEEETLLMGIMTKEFFIERGFKEDPVHFFASPGIISQAQNIRKWEGKEGIGIGTSTYQFMNNTQYHNFFDLGGYKALIDSRKLPIWVGKRLDRDEQMARTMVLGMKRGKVNVKAFEERFRCRPEEIFPNILDNLQNLGLIEYENDGISLSYKGELFSEEVAIQFFTENTKKAYEKVDSKYAGYSLAQLPDYSFG